MHTTLSPATIILIAAASAPLFGGQPMYVALCNNAGLGDQTVGEARHEIEITFDVIGASVNWVACEDIDSSKAQHGNLLFVIRLRPDKAWFAKRSVSLDAMGRAYTEERGSGYLADAYVPSVVKFRNEHDTDFTTLLGLVICHELGHLLLGPGHTEDGIMFGLWSGRQTEAARKRRLRFTQEQGAVIVMELQKRAN